MLPTTKTPPKNDLSDFTICLYGPTKIGKTTFCSRFDSVLFLATEPGLNSLDAFQMPITSWHDLLAAAKDIAAGGHQFKNVAIDTADNAYRFCEEFVCEKEGMKHPSDQDYGKGFALVNNEFQRVITKLAALPYGLILVSHAKEKEVKTPTATISKVIPTLPGGAYKIILGMCDMVLHADTEAAVVEEKEVIRRVIHTKPTPYWDAGDRTGRLPGTIPLSYPEFHKAFTATTATAGKKAA